MNGQKALARELAAAVVLALVAATAPGQVAKPVATVNGEAILPDEVEAILNMAPPTTTPLTEAQKKAARRDILEMLINEKVMKQFFDRELKGKAAFKPDSPEVNKQIADLVAGLTKKGSSLEKFLKESGQTEAQLRASVIKQLQWETYVADHLTMDTMKRYYEAYKPYFDKVLVQASHILIKLPTNAKDIDRQVARNKLRGLRQDILAGKMTFAEAAKKYSEDTATQAEGGNLGSFPRKFVVLESFAQAAFALKKGEISDPVETDFGMHLIQVTDRSAGEPTTFETAKEQVQRACRVEMANTILERERNAAKVVISMP
jgi:peptidyl-prolyl cis-trans isomerase C